MDMQKSKLLDWLLYSIFPFRVKAERVQAKELQKQLTHLDSLLAIESRLNKELLQKAQSCMDQLYKKREKLKHQRELLPDKPTFEPGPLPDVLDDL